MEDSPPPDLAAVVFARGKATLKDALWKGAAVVLLIAAAGSLLLVSSLFALYGAALGLSEFFGNRPWLGYLVTGCTVLFAVLLAFIIRKAASRRKAAPFPPELDPRPWIRDHPWETTGLAALGGFAVGIRSSAPEEAPAPSAGASQSPSVWDELIAAGVEILKNALTPLVATEVAKRINKEE